MAEAMNMNMINLNQIKDYVKANVALQCQQLYAPRLAIQGAPGTGKSDIIREICEENGWTLSVKYLSNMSLEQITGIPCKVESGSTAVWSKPELFNFDDTEYATDAYLKGDQKAKDNTVKVLLIDDFHLADRIMQKYLFQLLTYKSLNGYHLPPNTAILLAGNRNTDKALANPIPAPVCNRLMFIEVKSDSKDWLNNFAFKHGIREDITSFIYNHGDLYLSSEPLESGAWASPRAWTYLSYQMDSYEKMFGSLNINVLKTMASGLLGPEMTGKFIEYRELFAKWDFNKLFKEGIKSAQNKFHKECETNSTNVYAIINAGCSWLLTVYRDEKYDVETEKMKEALQFVYDTMTYLMLFPNSKIRRNTRPLIVAGVKYLFMFQQVMANKIKGKKTIGTALTACMNQDRDCDYLFFELLCYILDVRLSDDEVERIKEAKDKLKYDL